MCHLCGGRNSIFLCGGVFYFFLGRLVCRQVSLCLKTAKLSAELRSSGKSGQDVKGRWFWFWLLVVVSSVRLACNAQIDAR